MRQVKLNRGERAIEAALRRGEYRDVNAAEFAQIAEAVARMRSKARPDPDMPIGKLVRVKDVLPRSEKLAMPQDARKVDGRRKDAVRSFPRR